MSTEERESGALKLKVLFVLIVTTSAGMVALLADPTLPQLLAAIAGGFVVSVALLWYVLRTLKDYPTTSTGRR